MSKLKTYFKTSTAAEPMAVFRIGFGVMMLLSVIRFWSRGWIETLYIEPDFHFSYLGFEWVKPLGDFTYILFAICGVSALMVALGLKYRLAIITFFLSFTYIELMDKTTYLNHYYFISILSFLMIFLPANACYSVDNLIRGKSFKEIPKWTLDSIKILIAIVYFYAGLAKLNSDWLFEAMPLKIWLRSQYDLPLIGSNLMQFEWFHYAMSWSGALYDLCIPFLLFWKRTRWLAFSLVVFFHVFTRILFPIGMFPFIMIVSALVFMDENFHKKVISHLKRFTSFLVNAKKYILEESQTLVLRGQKVKIMLILVFFSFQLMIPFRHVLYPNELFWTEEGFRFSWRVMLMEKMGNTNFKVVDANTGKSFYVNNSEFLTPFQEKQMSFQPDFILEFAHFLGSYYSAKGYNDLQIFADSYVAINGRNSQIYIDPNVDLLKEDWSFRHRNWLMKFNDEIKGL